ncbi:Metallo-dependent phosphatase-like protein [Paraphysoderma sedebokerense]|nr:Metallo-dependent phosphatase-like protein [Paraphysoderma sedebokerense]
MLVLVIGDFFIPQRAYDIPTKFKKLLVPGKIQQILCTGNLTDSSTLDWLRSVAPDVQVVKGDYDDVNMPSTRVITHGPIKIGLIHGHQLIPTLDTETLALTARRLGDVDVLCTGFTCFVECFEYEGRMYVNPGSVTGAWKPGVEDASRIHISKDNKANFDSEATDGKNDSEKQAAADDDSASLRKIGPYSTPSFVLLDLQDTSMTLYVYQLIDDEVKIAKMEYKKPQADSILEQQKTQEPIGQ